MRRHSAVQARRRCGSLRSASARSTTRRLACLSCVDAGPSITAVVIGGISLFGGRGSIMGALFGALIVGVFQSGLRLAGVDVLWQVFATGWLIILAVALDQWIRKVSA